MQNILKTRNNFHIMSQYSIGCTLMMYFYETLNGKAKVYPSRFMYMNT